MDLSVWNGLQTRDPAAAAPFYANVFDWVGDRNKMGFFAVLHDPQGGVFHVMQSDPAFIDAPPGA